MSDEQVENAEKPTPEPVPLVTRDWFLQHLVSITNDSQKGFVSITLSVNGMLVAGILASVHEYFAETSKTLGKMVYGQEFSEARTEFEKNISDLGPDPLTLAVKQPFEDLTYVHIRDAKFFDAGGQSMNVTSTVWWRGRIAEVTGWSLGSFGRAE